MACELSNMRVRDNCIDVTLEERKMYTVEWRDGANFDFTFTPITSDRGTVLLLTRRTCHRDELTRTGLEDVIPGDLLIAIGNEKVYHLGIENATKYLRFVPKPVRLTLQISPYGNTNPVADVAPNEYLYEWVTGPLGLVLTWDENAKLPCVKRISEQANEVIKRDVAVGDQLIYANTFAASEYSMEELMSLLREMEKPILMRFRKPLEDAHLKELPELEANEYDFLWEYGPLGLVIGMAASGLPFVRSFTGKGTSRQLVMVHELDEIIMVNDRFTAEEGFSETMTYLMNVPKPAVLRFRRTNRLEDSTSLNEVEETKVEQARVVTGTDSLIDRSAANIVSTAPPLDNRPPSSSRAQLTITIPSEPTLNEMPQHQSQLDQSEKAEKIESIRAVPASLSRSNGSPTSNGVPLPIDVDLGSDSSLLKQGLTMKSQEMSSPTKPDMMDPNDSISLANLCAKSTTVEVLKSSKNVVKSDQANATHHEYEDTSLLFAEPLLNATERENKQHAETSALFTPTPVKTISTPLTTNTQPSGNNQYEDTSTFLADSVRSTEPNAAPCRASSNSESSVCYTVDESAFYTIKWTDGPFGLTVREVRSTRGSAILITKRTGKETCAGLRRVALGDLLVCIGDKNVHELGFEKATRYLRKVLKPVSLTFQAIE